MLGGLSAALPLAQDSPYTIENGRLLFDGADAGMSVEPVHRPAFYDLKTADGVSYEQLARLHGRDVLASTVVQTCTRYAEDTRCRFCATGTTTGRDRGARHLARCVRAIKERVPDLPIQVQCEPPAPDDLAALQELRDAGADAIGIHVESLDDAVRRRWMPGKAEVPLSQYWLAWREAVRLFGHNKVSTYLLVGLGEDADELMAGAQELISEGIYPFVVPFRPLAGTLATDVDQVPGPPPELLERVTFAVAGLLQAAGMRGAAQSAGCAACGACSALQTAGG
jgi:biotin synthase-related radical SAM superfamily protein